MGAGIEPLSRGALTVRPETVWFGHKGRSLANSPTSSAALQLPSNPGGQRTAIKILFLAAISPHLQPL